MAKRSSKPDIKKTALQMAMDKTDVQSETPFRTGGYGALKADYDWMPTKSGGAAVYKRPTQMRRKSGQQET